VFRWLFGDTMTALKHVTIASCSSVVPLRGEQATM
jgi:hypothetical protein